MRFAVGCPRPRLETSRADGRTDVHRASAVAFGFCLPSTAHPDDRLGRTELSTPSGKQDHGGRTGLCPHEAWRLVTPRPCVARRSLRRCEWARRFNLHLLLPVRREGSLSRGEEQ